MWRAEHRADCRVQPSRSARHRPRRRPPRRPPRPPPASATLGADQSARPKPRASSRRPISRSCASTAVPTTLVLCGRRRRRDPMRCRSSAASSAACSIATARATSSRRWRPHLPTVSEDGLTYTYTLREDAKYSDGTPIVAGDIVRAARALADPRNAFDYEHEICYVKGAHELLGNDLGCPEGQTAYADPAAGTFDDATIEGLLDQLGVTAPDPHTVVFQLYQPTSFWPDITAMWLLTPVPASATSWAEAARHRLLGPVRPVRVDAQQQDGADAEPELVRHDTHAAAHRDQHRWRSRTGRDRWRTATSTRSACPRARLGACSTPPTTPR